MGTINSSVNSNNLIKNYNASNSSKPVSKMPNNTNSFSFSTIGEYTQKISSGVKQAIENVKSDAEILSTAVGMMVDDASTSIKNTAAEIGSNITTAANNAEFFIDKYVLPAVDKTVDQYKTAFIKTGATAATIGLSLVEGLGQFGEAAVDTVSILGNVAITPITGLYDLGQKISTGLFGGEYDSLTSNVWNKTQAFVQKEFVTGFFDKIYEGTNLGKLIKENSYAFDTVRQVGNGVGYVGGIIAVSLLTGGVFGLATGTAGAGGASIGTMIAGNAIPQALTAAFAGFGKGAQESWKDGAGIGEGLGYAAGTAVWEGLQFWLGAKISGSKAFLPAGSGAEVTIKSKILNSLTKVALDGVDGGVEGFVQPLLKSIYKDGYYDPEGMYHEFDGDTLWDNYKKLFEENGGFQAVATNAAVGSITSAIGEGIDVGKFVKDVKDGITYYNFKSLGDINSKVLSDLDKGNSKFIVDGMTYTFDELEKALNSPKMDSNTKEKQKKLKPEVQKLDSEMNDIMSKAKEDGRFTFFELGNMQEILDSKANNPEAYEGIYNIMKDWDDHCNLSRESGEKLNEILNDPNSVFAIHRTNLGEITKNADGLPENSILSKIMDEGLINNGHALSGGGGAVSATPDLNLTTTPLDGIGGYIQLIGSYKENNVTVVLKFPDDLVSKDLAKGAENVHITKGNMSYINPDYIAGAIVKDENGFDQFFTKEQLLSQMKSNNEKIIDNVDIDNAIRNSNIIDNTPNLSKIDDKLTELRGKLDAHYGVDQDAGRNVVNFQPKNSDWVKDKELFSKWYKENLNADATLEEIEGFISHDNFSLTGKKNIINYISSYTDSYEDALNVFENSFKTKKADWYDDVITPLINSGMSETDAVKYVHNINSSGACSYAATCNSIISSFIDNPERYKEIFGYDMYRIDSNGNKILNSEQLLVDLYTFVNTDANGGSLLHLENGKLSLASLDNSEQVYLSIRSRTRDDLINDFLKSKSDSLVFTDGMEVFEAPHYEDILDKWVSYFGQNSKNMESNTVFDKIKQHLDAGENVQLGIYQNKDNPFVFYKDGKEYLNTNIWNEGGGHAVFVTDINADEVIISSWGEKLSIKLENFVNNDFNIIWNKLTDTGDAVAKNIDVDNAIKNTNNIPNILENFDAPQSSKIDDMLVQLGNKGKINYGVDQAATRKVVYFDEINKDWIKDYDKFTEWYKKEFPHNTEKNLKDFIESTDKTLTGKKTVIKYIETYTDSYEEALEVFNKSFSGEKKADWYDGVVKPLMDRGLSEEEAVKYLHNIDSVGACTYASTCNSIIESFIGKEEKFKKIFGYDMFRIDSNGNKVLNSEQLLVDLYTFANTDANGGKMFHLEDGKLSILTLDANEQVYLSKKLSRNNNLIDSFLKSKSPELGLEDKFLCALNPNNKQGKMFIENFGYGDASKVTTDEIYSDIRNLINEGYNIKIGVSPTDGSVVRFFEDGELFIDSNVWSEGEGHSVFLTDITDTEAIVSSWSKKLSIPLVDFINCNFNIIGEKITGIGG